MALSSCSTQGFVLEPSRHQVGRMLMSAPALPNTAKGQTRQAIDEGWITLADFQGNEEADVVANLGASAHAEHEPTAEYLRWGTVAQAVRVFWLLVGQKLRDRPKAWLRARLPAPAEVEEIPLAVPGEPRPQARHVEGPHRRVAVYNTFARCLVCHRQTGKVGGKLNIPIPLKRSCILRLGQVNNNYAFR
eukprot:5207442-Amphidinium_carterae.1